MTRTLQKTLIVTTCRLCVTLGASAQEAEGTSGTINSSQNNSAAFTSSLDFDVTADLSGGGTFFP